MSIREHFSQIAKTKELASIPAEKCKATHKITLEGEPVDFMYRDEPEFDGDSGWRFLSETESQAYADDPDNWDICDLNVLSGKDKAIIPYLKHPVGTALERVKVPDIFC